MRYLACRRQRATYNVGACRTGCVLRLLQLPPGSSQLHSFACVRLWIGASSHCPRTELSVRAVGAAGHGARQVLLLLLLLAHAC